MERTLLIEEGLFETRAALMQDGALIELQIERPEDVSLVGAFYCGRISKVLPDMEIAFIDLGSGEDGFIQLRDIAAKTRKIATAVHEGEKLLVQVIKDRLGDKAVQLGCRFGLESPNLIYRPMSQGLVISKQIQDEAARARITAFAKTIPDAGGLTVRTSARFAASEDLKAELQYLLKEWADITAEQGQSDKPRRLGRIQTPLTRILQDQLASGISIIFNSARALNEAKDYIRRVMPSTLENLRLWDKRTPLFEMAGAEEQLERALQKRVRLKSGANITLEQTEAMVVVDVNSASLTSSSGTKSVALYTNLEAADEICRQIRLRNYSGIIVIDFIQMNGKGEAEKLKQRMQSAFDDDPVPTRLVGVTELGLMQVTRKRVRKSLSDILRNPCPACEGSGTVDGATAVLSKLLRALEAEVRHSHTSSLTITVSDELAKKLERHKISLEAHLARPLVITIDSRVPAHEYKIG